ncbi:MAG: PHP domain-containing protein [Anaerolineae bacterium]
MSIPLWTLELHCHTIYSHDSLLRLDAIQGICRERGIDRIAITDHNRAKGALELAHMYPMLIIPGEEIMTTRGELLAWYIKEEVPPGLSPQATIDRLREQGALIGVAHPMDRYRKGAWQMADLLAIIDQVDVIEVFNARCLHAEDNRRALAFAEKYGKLKSAGSDAHTPREYGRATVKVRPFANNAEGLRQALADAQFETRLSGVGVHLSSTYAKWIKRLIPSLRVK